MSTSNYTEHRCTCGKLLCKGFIRDGEIEIKCKRCGAMKRIAPPLLRDRPEDSRKRSGSETS